MQGFIYLHDKNNQLILLRLEMQINSSSWYWHRVRIRQVTLTQCCCYSIGVNILSTCCFGTVGLMPLGHQQERTSPIRPNFPSSAAINNGRVSSGALVWLICSTSRAKFFKLFLSLKSSLGCLGLGTICATHAVLVVGDCGFTWCPFSARRQGGFLWR